MQRFLGILSALVFLLAIQPCTAQEPDQGVRAAFDSIVAANTYPIEQVRDSLRGPGAKWLVNRARDAHHFMIGERHGTAEIPQVAAALYERIKPVGYDIAALEIGPYAARDVNAALNRGGYDSLSTLLTRYDTSPVAFLDAKEEARLTARIVSAGGTIWGLDQEFSSSLPLHLDALARQAETEQERLAVKKVRSKMTKRWSEGGDYLGNAEPNALRTLRAAFEPRGDEKALARIDAMIKSNAIYAPYLRDTGSFYHSGVQRENYMKRVLVDHVRRVERRTGGAPRIFYKFGGFHSGQHPGTDLDPRVSIGTFVSEWARTLRGEESVHVIIDCKGGAHEASGQGPGGQCAPGLTAPAAAEGTESPFANHLHPDRITLIDLTALRDRFGDWEFLTERARMMIFAADAYVTVPSVTPPTVFDRFRPQDSGSK